MRRLIVNADDFGMTGGINRAVAELQAAGAMTSATLMAESTAFDEAVAESKRLPGLGVGCHVVLVDGSPVLPGVKIPSLFGENHAGFRAKLGAFVADLLRGKIKERDIEAEAVAQIGKLLAAGIRVTHVDTHKHTHMFPGVLRPLLRAALGCGVKAIRNPFEPDWSLEATTNAGAIRRVQVKLLRTQKATFLREVDKAGLATTDGAIGVLATGTLDGATIESLLKSMPGGTWELVTHPGYCNSDLKSVRTRLLESREVERDALLKKIPQCGVELIHFGRLPA